MSLVLIQWSVAGSRIATLRTTEYGLPTMPTIVVIGASSDRSKFGNKCVRAYARRGWTIYPVHPKEISVEGLPAYKSILDVPAAALDRVSIYLPPAVGVKVM